MFSGQGAQFWPLDLGLVVRFPVFREMLLRCETQLAAEGVQWSLLEQLCAPDGATLLRRADVCQPAIFACQVALAALWRSWGIAPAAVVGHSLGEVAAAYVAGILSLAEAVHLVVKRGQITAQASGKGAMALVGVSMEAARKLIRTDESVLAVAVSNSPTNCVLSGDPAALEAKLVQLEQRGIFARRLSAIDYAAHSPQMEPLKHELSAALTGLPLPRRGNPLLFYRQGRCSGRRSTGRMLLG
ncbi:MAG: acyltransferase domain-containing protein [Anaerolineales bacterium]|nr:acyltransferase domain-containing protein [Anaerolineales bacterium]